MNYSGIITKNEYVLTNIDIETGKFIIRLNDDKEYPVSSIKLRNKKDYYIIKNNKPYKLDDEVKSWYLNEKIKYLREGI